MKNLFKISLILFSNLFFSQNNFKIVLNAPEFEKSYLSVGPPMSRGNIHNIYNFELSKNNQISFKKGFSFVTAQIMDTTIIEGEILYPQPFSISYYDPKINGGFETKLIFIEKGNFNITVNKQNNLDFVLNSKSPLNEEYKLLKGELKIFDKNLKPFEDNNPTDIEIKQKFLQNYIKKNPNSFVAFWEIVNDFSKLGFNKSYLRSLSLFSNNVKKTFSYIEFKKIIDTENSTNVGGIFPEVLFDDNLKISKADFAKYNLTLIDYWSTTCKPCIQDLPNLVRLYEMFKDKGVNFISVTDENEKKKIDLATSILEKNKVTWKNYFDTNDEFPKKLNAAGYPLQILVDVNGKIVARKLGELNQIEVEIKKYIK